MKLHLYRPKDPQPFQSIECSSLDSIEELLMSSGFSAEGARQVIEEYQQGDDYGFADGIGWTTEDDWLERGAG